MSDERQLIFSLEADIGVMKAHIITSELKLSKLVDDRNAVTRQLAHFLEYGCSRKDLKDHYGEQCEIQDRISLLEHALAGSRYQLNQLVDSRVAAYRRMLVV